MGPISELQHALNGQFHVLYTTGHNLQTISTFESVVWVVLAIIGALTLFRWTDLAIKYAWSAVKRENRGAPSSSTRT